MTKYPSPILIMLACVACFTVGILIGKVFLPPTESGAEVAPTEAPALISCVELQRKLNRRNPKANLVEDGVCGELTQKEWDSQCGTQYSLKFWPEDAK